MSSSEKKVATRATALSLVISQILPRTGYLVSVYADKIFLFSSMISQYFLVNTFNNKPVVLSTNTEDDNILEPKF
jgi:hypothetical protein